MRAGPSASTAALAALVITVAATPAIARSHRSVDSINASIRGTLLDFTDNHGCDARVYSPALCECRDLYVYLPPGYDPNRQYPLIIWLHSYTTDEREFVRDALPVIDRAVAAGDLPPAIVAAPDGSLRGNSLYVTLGSWYVNSRRGRFADYIVEDVLLFMERNFPVCRDRAGRALVGFSMGGFGAYSLGLKNPDKFKVLAGISPALNIRYVGPCGDYQADFHPDAWSLRTDYHPKEVIGSFYGGLVKIRAWHVAGPVWGQGPEAVQRISADNPIELLERPRDATLPQDYYVGYGKSDELNIDAQVESFLYVASQRGIAVDSRAYPCGDHSIQFMTSALPDLFAWLKAHLACPPASGP